MTIEHRHKIIFILILLLAAAQWALADIHVYNIERRIAVRHGDDLPREVVSSELGEFAEQLHESQVFTTSAAQNSQVVIAGDVLQASGNLEVAIKRDSGGSWAWASTSSEMTISFHSLVESTLTVDFHNEGTGSTNLWIYHMSGGVVLVDFTEEGDYVDTIDLVTGDRYYVVVETFLHAFGMAGNTAILLPQLCSSMS